MWRSMATLFIRRIEVTRMAVIIILAIIGVYHIIEEIMWQVNKLNNPEDIAAMIEYVEKNKKK